MCSVQVVLFAEVMGRRSTGGVCRRLFSDAPTEKKVAADPGSFLRAMEVELRRRDTERWNFDFQKEKPLPGRYQWVAVGAKKENENGTEVKEEIQEVKVVDEVVRPQKVPSSIPESKRMKRSSSAGVATQAKITDFLKKRKRLEPEESHQTLKMRRLNPNLESNNSVSTEAGHT